MAHFEKGRPPSIVVEFENRVSVITKRNFLGIQGSVRNK